LIRYVGKTHTPRVRHIQHCSETGTTEKCVWIETLRIEGIFPQMIILSECPDDESARLKEREMMELHGSANADDAKPAKQEIQSLVNSTRKLHRQSIIDALAKSNGNIAPAAKLLGISRPTLYDKIKRLGIVTLPQGLRQKRTPRRICGPDPAQAPQSPNENHYNRDLLYLIGRQQSGKV
jgi:Bacterial regulatory protein, Fis family